MKKLILLVVLAFIIQTTASSQSCLPDGITFSTQAEIDSFQTNYPNCTEIEGNVIISGSDITNLTGLSILTSFGGDVIIWNNDMLVNLTGLENITSLEGNLRIGDHVQGGNPSMTSLTGLNNLTSIGGILDIKLNYALTSLAALDKLSSIGGRLSILRCDALTSLTGLDNVNSIGEYLEIYKNASLITLMGLENLTSIGGKLKILENQTLNNLTGLDNLPSIGGELWIYRNENLTNLMGLDNVTYIGGDIDIYGNDFLTSLTGLNNVVSIDGDFLIINNDALTSLTGLDNINAETINDLRITDNSSLSTCEVQSVCDYIASPNGVVTIRDNATGCNSEPEVEEACQIIGVPNINIESEFTIYPNPAKNELFISCKNGIVVKEVNVYNQLGQRVLYEAEITNQINVSMLGQGMYVIELISYKSRIRDKLIIK